MNDHLSAVTLNALVDGQLAAEELRGAKEHLDHCPACTSEALEFALLKNAVARNGQRHSMPAGLEAKVRSQIAEHQTSATASSDAMGQRGTQRSMAFVGWAAAAALLLSVGSAVVVEQRARISDAAAIQNASLAAEVVDQHVATLANSQPPQVLSSDRHTVKPWFQGKIPFSFNLPETLPQDTRLDGANLAYLHNHPVAQLLYSIGRHRVSVFVMERTNSPQAPKAQEHEGYHLLAFSTGDLDAVAISDVDPARLVELVHLIAQAQGGSR